MTTGTPLLYERLVGSDSRPPLQQRALIALRESVSGLDAIAQEYQLDAFLAPMPFRTAVNVGFVGIPILSLDELTALTAGARSSSDLPSRGRWWEFWPTEQGTYAMFSADAEDTVTLVVVAFIRHGQTVHFRRFDPGLLFNTVGDLKERTAARLLIDGCVHAAHETEPGSPFVGRCENTGCAKECDARVTVHRTDGVHVLTGCECPH